MRKGFTPESITFGCIFFCFHITFLFICIFLFFSECIDKCTINEKTGRIPACAYICEMTHGYENLEFLETINCLVDNKCLNEYPKGEVFQKKNFFILKVQIKAKLSFDAFF